MTLQPACRHLQVGQEEAGWLQPLEAPLRLPQSLCDPSVLHLQISREDAGRLQALETELEAAQKELVKLESSTSQLQGQAAALQKQIEGVGGPKMAKQRVLIAKLQKVRGAACDTPRAGHLGSCVM